MQKVSLKSRSPASTLYSVGWPAPALVVPVGRPPPRSHSRFAVDAGLAPAAGSTGTAPAECETQSARPGGAESPSETEKPSLLPITSTSRRPGGQRYLYYFVDLLSGPETTASTILLAAFPSRFLGLGFGAGGARGGPLVVYWRPERGVFQNHDPVVWTSLR